MQVVLSLLEDEEEILRGIRSCLQKFTWFMVPRCLVLRKFKKMVAYKVSVTNYIMIFKANESSQVIISDYYKPKKAGPKSRLTI